MIRGTFELLLRTLNGIVRSVVMCLIESDGKDASDDWIAIPGYTARHRRRPGRISKVRRWSGPSKTDRPRQTHISRTDSIWAMLLKRTNDRNSGWCPNSNFRSVE